MELNNYPLPYPSLSLSLLDAGVEPNTKAADRIIANMQRTMEHPWSAVEDGYVFTLDPKNLREPIRRLPNHPWLRTVANIWMKENLLAIVKSRQMITTWTMDWCHLWLAMFHPGAAVFIQSDVEVKSDEQIQRCEFIYRNIPQGELVLPKLKNGRATWCYMGFPGLQAYMRGIAQGANQLRQLAASAVLMDEAGFWEKGRESFAATKPTVEGGGKVTIMCSANPGWFRDICMDEVR